MVRNVDSPSKFLMYPRFIQVVLDHQVDDMATHNTRYKSHALTQKVFANMRRVGKGFLGVKTPLFDSMLVQSQPQAEEGVESGILYWYCLGAEDDASKQGELAAIDADEGITLVDVETDEEEVSMDVESQGRTNLKDDIEELFDQENVNTASKGFIVVIAPELVSTAEPIVFDDEDLAARDEQERADIEKALELQKQLDEREDDIDWSAIAEQVKEKTVRLSQKISRSQEETSLRMNYDEIRPIFEREYNKVQTLFKKDKDVQNKKRIVDETLLQASFKKLRAAEVSGYESTQEILTDDPKEINEEDVQNMLEIVSVPEFRVEALQIKYPIIDWEIHTEGPRKYWKIIRVGGITEAYQTFEDMLKGFDKEDIVALWNLVKERFRSAEPIEDKERALWVKLKRLFEPDANDEKDYPLSNAVMILMLSGKLQVEEDNEMARDLVMKMFIEANRPRNRSV
nr:hypothetical protein [Tanacetum cinerariifolium]